MRSAWTAFIGLTIIASSYGAFAQSAPEGFRDLKWGATQEQVVAAFPSATCKNAPSEMNDWTCTVRGETVNEVTVMVMIGGFTTGKAIGMSTFLLSFKPEGFDRIVEAFESRYGKQTRVQANEYVTQSGQRLPNPQHEWVFPSARITVIQHTGRTDNGLAIVGLNAGMEESQARREQRKSKARKGL